ncbi:surfactin synthase thioesterase subunit [Lachnotalea glycerini]|uniref:Thioesterase n=1 Tax=Lachnotalea glycerini TaxID=1763509 RepID=A0A255I6Q0_9FIRM|nr:thioesterase domain-containing protein [Lachnotalea glycerini]PXV95880.1 surfactin synthase thioesterase subunit [Lachnotalea glycerini]RDY33065.1 thioesterase [Lachnotalea glycerini]
MKKVKLFCLAHAGGSAMYYCKWKKMLSDSIELIPLELAGRGNRITENFYNNCNEAINDILKQVSGKLDNSEFAFWGHSMGTIITYELARKLKELKEEEPVCMFFSGRCPPHIIKKEEKIHILPNNEFINKIKEYGGMPDEVLKEEQLMKLVTPILKADFKLIDDYKYVNDGFKFNCDIVALIGKDDKGGATKEFREWSKYTNGNCKIYELEGGHFYLNDREDEILNIINQKLVFQ